MFYDVQSINGLGVPVLCWMEEVPPNSDKVPALVLCRVIRIEAGLNVVGLLYRKPFFYGRFVSLARRNYQTNDSLFLIRLSRPRSFDWAHLKLKKSNMCDA